MAGDKSSPKTPSKKGTRGEDDSKRGHAFVPRAPRIARKIVNPRGNRKGR